MKGPKVDSVQMSSGKDANGSTVVPVEHGSLQLSMSGSIEDVKHYTTVERFKADAGHSGFYVQLRPNCSSPSDKKPPGKVGAYTVKFQPGNSAVRHLYGGRHSGNCFRVYGGISAPEQGILIHEAPNVSWVIGCIGPRPLRNFSLNMENAPGNPSCLAMQELFQFVGKAAADFWVLDW